ncbi:hypothetical protein A5893_15680 [Pedobacter psychrophilus]|uniref:LVIVD repeat-containing protein n=1 Tax=Pedobacter psychrophilus TaxID=1826909 RepID=A0A179DB11_9SPHI|nr:hypothetical protein [Pedobacter psychrophilus]OAQ38236.1 hypothetical protein A5893_15680 [Pedobacter psychrophilus]
MKTRNILYIILIFLIASCSKDAGSSTSSSDGFSTGTAGSLARFAIVGDNLYTVTKTDVKIFDISEASNPIYKVDKPFGFGIETIFPLGNTLFLGSETGMYIYDISNPLAPKQLSQYRHILSCDPVVANENYAYITLSSGATRCSRGLTQLEVIDIKDKKLPKVAKIYPMNNPKGLALNGNDLFVCDDNVKWFDATDNVNLIPKGIIDVKANDAIAIGKLLMLIGENGLTQYDYSGKEPVLLSSIKIGFK